MTDSRQHSRGFALAFSLVFLVIVSFVAMALFGTVSFSTRMTSIYLGRSRCRLAAQSAIEWAKSRINTAFEQYTGVSTSTVRIGPKASTAYAWFNTAAGVQTIGTGTYAFTLPASTNLNGCTVRMWFGPSGQVENSSSAIVSLIVEATRLNPNGTTSEIVVEERFRFGTGRSRVFDYAYFVNNYGWFQGSGGTANGDVRANGDMYLDSSCTINGDVWAARNDELRVSGSINNRGQMDSRRNYWASAKTTTQSRPTSPTYDKGGDWVGGYNAPQTVTSTDLAKRTHPNEETGITMPWISDLSEYVQWAQEEGGTLSGGLRYSLNSSGSAVSTNNPTINAHYDGVGPSGNTALSDKGALVLEGTKTNPIRLKGPVVVDSDVVIKGYVTGQGTIYSGRNIHIVGDITYVNPPVWNHPDSNPEATAKANSAKDLVGLAAKGNIVLGDSTTDSIFTSDIRTYLTQQPYVQQYVCDASDKNIGYPRSTQYGYTANETKFCGNYTAADGGNQVKVTTTTTYDSKLRKNVTKTTIADSHTRKYYQSVVADALVKKLGQTTTTSGGRTSTTTPLITHIDGVLYNNHGIFGKIGSCTINGALICRNEGILYSSAFNINWDIRLREDSAEGIDNKAGMPVGASPPGVVSWHELPSAAIANYPRN